MVAFLQQWKPLVKGNDVEAVDVIAPKIRVTASSLIPRSSPRHSLAVTCSFSALGAGQHTLSLYCALFIALGMFVPLELFVWFVYVRMVV